MLAVDLPVQLAGPLPPTARPTAAPFLGCGAAPPSLRFRALSAGVAGPSASTSKRRRPLLIIRRSVIRRRISLSVSLPFCFLHFLNDVLVSTRLEHH